MYAFLDRTVDALDDQSRFLLGAMRHWVAAARAGQCPCRAIATGFVAHGAIDAACDFAMAMATLDRDAARMLRFGAIGQAAVTEDEACLLGLFAAAMAGTPERARRSAAAIVDDEAIARLALAAERVAMQLSDGVFVEHGR